MKCSINTIISKMMKILMCGFLLILILIICAVLVFFYKSIKADGYTQTSLRTDISFTVSDKQDVKEIYEALKREYSKELEDHVLTEFSTVYVSPFGGEPDYQTVTFEFYTDIDNSAEGGKISVVNIEYDLKEEKVIFADRFVGSGKAYGSGTGKMLPETIFDHINQSIKDEEVQNNELNDAVNKRVKVWVTGRDEVAFHIVEIRD